MAKRTMWGQHTHPDEGTGWYWMDHGGRGRWHDGKHHYHDADGSSGGWLGAARYNNAIRPIDNKQAEVLWWCDHKGEGVRLSMAYGGVNMENYCIPHIDLDRLQGSSRGREWYEARHRTCGPAIIWRKKSRSIET